MRKVVWSPDSTILRKVRVMYVMTLSTLEAPFVFSVTKSIVVKKRKIKKRKKSVDWVLKIGTKTIVSSVSGKLSGKLSDYNSQSQLFFLH